MLTEKDRNYAQKRKKVWDSFGWVYRGINYLSKNHSLNCGCATCQLITYHKRLKNKRQRLNAKDQIKDELNAL